MSPVTLSASASASPAPSRITNDQKSKPFNSDPTIITPTLPSTDSNNPPPPDDELTFLALHYLHSQLPQHSTHNSSDDNSTNCPLQTLATQLSTAGRLPTALDTYGSSITLTYSQLAQRYKHISSTFLKDLLQHNLPPRPLQVASLLANGRFAPPTSRRPRPRKRDLSVIKKRETSSSNNIIALIHRLVTRIESPSVDALTYVLLPKSFRHLKRLIGHHLTIFTTLFDCRGEFAVTGSDDNLIKIWSIQTGFLQHTLRGHDSDIIEIVRHPTHPIIVSASSDSTLRVWNINTGAALYVLDGGSREVNTVTFSPCPDRPYLVSGGADGSVRLWNADNFEAGHIRIPIPVSDRPSNFATDTARTGGTLAATSNAIPSSPVNDHTNNRGTQSNTRATAVGSATTIPSNFGQQGPSTPVGPNTEIVTNPHQSQNLYSQTQQQPLTEGMPALPSPTSSDMPGRAANSVVSGTPSYEVLSVVFNAGATRLAVSGSDCVAYVYAIEKDESNDSALPTVRLLTKLRGHSDNVIQVLFSRSGDNLITAGKDGIARIWKRTAARLADSKNRESSVSGMGSWTSTVLDCRGRMQADAPSMLSGGATGSAAGSVVPRLRRQYFPVRLCAAMWSLNDDYVITSSSDTKIRVWNAKTGRLLRTLDEHCMEVYAMDCHPTNGRILLSAGYDGKCILWDIESGRMLRKMSIPCENGEVPNDDFHFPSSSPCPQISDGQFSSDGLSFIVADTSGAVNFFGTGSGEEVALAPTEQFFSNDCAPYRRDEQRRAIDENTRQLLHLVPRGRLCNKDFRPHPPELQPQYPDCIPPKITQNGTNVDGDNDPNLRAQRGLQFGVAAGLAQDKRREALLLRAKEFRENQEKEESRLVREAREARRRMIRERRKADLKRDIEPSYLDVRNFEVPDSDYEESDKDFDGENESSHSESSSGSSVEEDEITPANWRRHRNNPSDRRDRQSRNTRGRSTRHNPRSKHVTDSHSDSVDSDIEGNDDSPDYEVDTLDSDTDNSSSSGARVPRGSVDEEDNKQSKHRDRPRKSRRGRKGQNKIDRNQRDPDLIENPVALLNRGRNIVRLEGSVIRHGGHRMRIRVNKSNATVNNSSAPSIDMRQSQSNGNATFSEANEGGKDVMRNHLDANGAGPSQPLSTTPLNPSFTSERQQDTRIPTDNNIDAPDARKTSATLTAPEQSKSVDAEGNHANQSNEITPQSLNDKRNGRRHRWQSPAQKPRKKWKTRSRSHNQTDQMVDAAPPTVDIDELAERELEILDEKRSRKKSNKRRRRSRDDNNEHEDPHSDGSHRKRNRQDGEDSSTRHGRTHRRRSARRTEGTDASYKQQQETVHETRPLEGSAWLRTSRNAYTYVPQHGDDVIYFQQGHLAALEEAKSEGLELAVDDSTLRDTKGRVLDGKTLGRDADPLRLQIVNITFHFTCAGGESRSRHGNARSKSRKGIKENTTKQTKTFLTLTLKPVHVTTQQQAHFDTYLLTYYPVDAPEYLVLTSRVEAALNRGWRIGDRVRILFLNEQREWQYYTGTIRTVSPTIKTVIWNTVEVEYDNEEEKGKAHLENVSPWEVEAQEGQLGSRDNQQSHLSKTSFEPGLFPLLARELEGFRNMDPSWRTNPPWLDSAESLASSPGYCKAVPCPLDLNTVIVRVCTGYYRQFSSFLHDLWLMKANSLRIHGAQSEQGLQAINFFTRLIETCERVRVQFLSQYAPILPAIATQYAPPAGVTIPSTARTIRPRPSPAEVSGQTALTPSNFGVPNTGRPFLPSMNNRMGNIGFAAPIFPTSENGSNQHMASSSHVRTWNGQRGYQPGVQTHMQTGFTNSHPGVGLPPAVPVQSTAAATAQRSGARSTRPNTRTQGNRQQTNGHTRTTNLTIPPVIHQGSNIATTSTSMPAPMAPHMIPSQVIMTTPIIGGSAMQQNSIANTRIPEVASSQIHNNQGRGPSSSSQRPTQTQAFSHSRVPVRSSSQALNMPPSGSRPSGSDNGSIPIVKHYQMVGTQSPIFDNGQLTAPLPPMPVQQRHTPRSTSGDGGTHSWGRSMEGAGGVSAMHAATSESHAPRSGNHGQSQSPISPSGARLESLNSLVRHQGISGLLSPAAPADHEHSVISNAAAESTMSCGGADVALQAGTAESEEVGTQRNSRRRR